MTLTFKTEIRFIEKPRAQGGCNVILEKQVWNGEECVGRQDHAYAFVADPGDKDALAFHREQMAALGDMTIGLVPLTSDQIEQIMAVHADFWTGPQLHPLERPDAKFEDFVKHAIETQPELADAKAALEARRAEIAASRAEAIPAHDAADR